MNFRFVKAVVFNRGKAPDAFLNELVEFGKTAPEDIFAPRPDEPGESDIYNAVKPELGPWESMYHRRAVMLEVMRVLAGFESSWTWTEGVDTSRLGDDTPENAESGAWQVSYDARHISPELSILLTNRNVTNGVKFQQAMKFDHPFAMEFIARLMRHTRKANGPLYKGGERDIIRKSLRGQDNSIYPWISRQAVEEFKSLIMPI